jgi:hypothetical protein
MNEQPLDQASPSKSSELARAIERRSVLLEMGPAHPAGGASVSYLENIRAIVRRLAEEAGT